MCAFYLGLRTDAMTAGTMAFATLTLSRLLHGFNCRSEKSLVHLGVMSNRWSVGGVPAWHFASCGGAYDYGIRETV